MVSKGLTIHNNYIIQKYYYYTSAKKIKSIIESHHPNDKKYTYRYALPITIILLRVSTNKHQPTLKLKDVLIRPENTKH